MDVLIAFGGVTILFVAGVWASRVMQEHELHPHAPHHWKWVTSLCAKWKKLEDFTHAHRKPFHRLHGLVHASYFGMVFTHGPYNVVAGLLLIIAVAGWLLHLEDH